MAEECPKCEAGLPAWLATFADLMSLLMCFFVLLLSFAEIDAIRFKKMADSMKDAFGVQREIPTNEIVKTFRGMQRAFVRGRTIVPGFVDAHVHPMFGALMDAACSLQEVTTPEALREALAACLADAPQEMLVGFGVNQSVVAFDQALFGDAFDAQPVLLIAFLGIVAWAWSSKRKTEFEQAAQLPLGDDERPGGADSGQQAGTIRGNKS